MSLIAFAAATCPNEYGSSTIGVKNRPSAPAPIIRQPVYAGIIARVQADEQIGIRLGGRQIADNLHQVGGADFAAAAAFAG
ncbi:hypothetical protein HMSSN036_19690 [Paenibacillus macerans]|nr:hypothetical protein HMSSN036_19690 [Paenibacillus macerans]